MAASAPALGAEDEEASVRRCIVSGASGARDPLIRFVVAADGTVVPDIAERLPGRGVWLTADRELIASAIRRKLFARAARRPVQVAEDLVPRLERLLRDRCCDRLGLARRAGAAVAGYERVRERLASGRRGVLVEAYDGAPRDRGALRALSGGMPVVAVLSAEELGGAFGRGTAVHGFIDAGPLADTFARDAARLAGVRVGADRMHETARVHQGRPAERAVSLQRPKEST